MVLTWDLDRLAFVFCFHWFTITFTSPCHCCDSRKGYYCVQGAATPVPCPGGTWSNVSSISSEANCSDVQAGYWAPLGSELPEQCPASGFYCPGKNEDTVNSPGGSKPIIVPVGSSTTTREVDTVEKEMTLDLDCATFDMQTVRQTLADQYGVDVALVTFDNPCARRRQLRGRLMPELTLTITIATEGTAADGTSVSAPVASLLTAVQAVDDAAIGNSLGAALNTTVTVTASTAPEQAKVEKTIKFECPLGHWCTAGLIVPCSTGTYNNQTGQNFATACREWLARDFDPILAYHCSLFTAFPTF